MKKFITVTLLSFALNSFAQQSFVKGYVIQLGGDTLFGEIKINPKKQLNMFQKVTIKEKNGQQRTLKPEKVLAYCAGEDHFISGKNEEESVFYKVISDGNLCLLKLHYEVLLMNDIKEKEDYFMMSSSLKEPVRLKHGRFKKQLAEKMADNSELVKELEEDKSLEIENLPEVFDKYNAWAKNNKG